MALHDTITDLAATLGREIGAVQVLAGGDPVTVAAVRIRWAGMDRDDAIPPTPNGVRAIAWGASPQPLIGLGCRDLDDIHEEALAAAWEMGAWDVSIMSHPARQGGPILPGDIDCADHHDEALRLAWQTEGLRSWSWRPSAGGPPMRRRQWLARDDTLSTRGDRDISSLPRMPRPPMIGACVHQTVLTLGTSRKGSD